MKRICYKDGRKVWEGTFRPCHANHDINDPDVGGPRCVVGEAYDFVGGKKRLVYTITSRDAREVFRSLDGDARS